MLYDSITEHHVTERHVTGHGLAHQDMTEHELAWQDGALCAQTGAQFFFPDPGSSVREAKQICAACPIRSACLEYALDNDERFGVWGGLSEKERHSLRRARPRVQA